MCGIIYVTSAVDLIKMPFFKSSKELTLAVRSGKAQNSGYPKWQTLRVNADHGRDFHPLADNVTTFHQGLNSRVFCVSIFTSVNV